MATLRWLSIWAFVLWASPSYSASPFPAKYDGLIGAAAEHYWPGLPWRLWKAQLFQESRLDPSARSPVGAAGLAQFMPATWAEVSKALGYGLVDRDLAEPAIMGGAYYMAQLRKRWLMPDLERHRFAQAGYNAGNGNISRAQRACASEVWDHVIPCLPSITGAHAKETTGYVASIFKWWGMMEAGK